MQRIENLGHAHFHGVLGGKNVSAIDFWQGRALLVADEADEEQGNLVQAYAPDGDDFRPVPGGSIQLDLPHAGKPPEMDLEGIAVDGNSVFVLGSHSWRRRKAGAEQSYQKNRQLLAGPPEPQPGRDVLLRCELEPSGRARSIERSSLRDVLLVMEPFKSFSAIASKENGIDAEGLAYFDGHVYVGFRGPVLRGNFAIILKCRFAAPIHQHETLFVDLGGRGVRDLAHVPQGLLILAGPVGDGPGSYQLYLWDGRDGVPGVGAPVVEGDQGLLLLGEIPLPEVSAKPEGLAVSRETHHHWEIIIVFDGLKNGRATRFRVEKPARLPVP